MDLKWEPKYGPAFVTGIVQIVVMMITGAIVWTNLQNDVKAANVKIDALDKVSDRTADLLRLQESRIVKSETAIEFIVPSLKRIEDTINTIARK